MRWGTLQPGGREREREKKGNTKKKEKRKRENGSGLALQIFARSNWGTVNQWYPPKPRKRNVMEKWQQLCLSGPIHFSFSRKGAERVKIGGCLKGQKLENAHRVRNIKIDRLPEIDKNNTNPNGAEGLQRNNKKKQE